MKSIEEIEKDLAIVKRMDDRNWLKVISSESPEIDLVFAVSSDKLRSVVKDERDLCKCGAADEK